MEHDSPIHCGKRGLIDVPFKTSAAAVAAVITHTGAIVLHNSLFLIGGLGLAAAASMNIVKRTVVHRFDRRQLSYGQRPTPVGVPAAITSVTTTQAQVVFSPPVVVASLPQYLTNGVAPTVVTSPSPGTFLLTYAATIATHTLVIPQNDPAIRTAQGGYAIAQAKTF